jgi:nitrile hydratase beta subunit
VEGVHDLGGLHGFGSVAAEAESDEPVFHEVWEGRTFGLMMATAGKGLRGATLRADIEAMPPAEYLASSYYERWAYGLERALVERGVLARAEIDGRAADAAAPEPTVDEHYAARLLRGLQRKDHDWPAAPTARFAAGDRVTVRRMAPVEHHRCPRYLRGAAGTVTWVAGGFPRPGGTDPSEALYTVRFDMAELWGEDAEAGSLYVDLWEGYLT